MRKSDRDFSKVAYALSISEVEDKSSQIGTQTQLAIAGVEVLKNNSIS